MTDQLTPTAPPPEAFRLQEAMGPAVASPLREDGTVDIMVIRPSIGRGKGRHLYTSEMLEANAHKFAGWKMYNNHLTEAARRALGGLPRPIEHQGGRLLESWWDPSVPAEGRFDQGAVMAKVRPVGIARQLIQEDPDIMEASINARATGVRQVTRGGVKCWLVEGIEDTGSVDWVSEGGAGGRVASLVEAYFRDEEAQELARLDGLSDTDLIAHLRRERPELVEALSNEPGESGDPNEGGAVKLTVKDLQEALATDEGQEALRELVTPLVEAQVEEKVAERLEEERDLIIAEANAESDRRVELRDLRDTAHKLIEGSGLPDSFKKELREAYTITDGSPSAALDVVEEVKEDGTVEKTAEQVLRESVEQAITGRKTALREAAPPTRVNGQGGRSEDGGESRGGGERVPLFHRHLQEAGQPIKPAAEREQLKD